MRYDVYASERHDASQKLGEEVRSSGGAGLISTASGVKHGERVFNRSKRQALGRSGRSGGTNELSPPILGSAHPASFLRVTESARCGISRCS